MTLNLAEIYRILSVEYPAKDYKIKQWFSPDNTIIRFYLIGKKKNTGLYVEVKPALDTNASPSMKQWFQKLLGEFL